MSVVPSLLMTFPKYVNVSVLQRSLSIFTEASKLIFRVIICLLVHFQAKPTFRSVEVGCIMAVFVWVKTKSRDYRKVMWVCY